MIVLPDTLSWVIEALDALTADGLPPVAIVGGIAVAFRLAAVGSTIRPTADLDVVARGDAPPTALSLLTQRKGARKTENGVVLDGVKVDVMEVHPLTASDLDGMPAGQALFVSAHGWAFDTATRLTVGTASREQTVTIPVAEPAALVAMKAHALGFARAARRANKRPGDLYDLFALLSGYDGNGAIRTSLAEAPFGLGPLVARVLHAEMLTSRERTIREIRGVAETAIDSDEFTEVMETFVAGLS